MVEIEKLFDKAVAEIERMLNTKTVVGEPITIEGTTLIPLVNVGFGFGVGGGEGTEPQKGTGKGGGTGGGGGVKPVAVDDNSWNTLDNAVNTVSLVRQLGLQRIAIVTHGWHIPRAMWSFNRTGIEALAAPMGLTHSTSDPAKVRSWYPYSIALLRSDKAIHEYAGMLWYRLRADQQGPAAEKS